MAHVLSIPLPAPLRSMTIPRFETTAGVRIGEQRPYSAVIESGDTDNVSNESLMLAYRKGDSAALRELFRRYAPLILAIGRRHLRSESLAQDLVQQTFLRLHTARNDFSADRKLHPFLLTIAMNLVRDEWRRQRRKPTETLQSEPAVFDAGYDPDKEAQLRTLRTALQSLSEADRAVIELHWFQDRGFAEVADILGISQGAARVRAHRASARLRAATLQRAADEEA